MMASFQDLRITVLGSGTSAGVPTIGCDCDVCRSDDPRDQRLRPSVYVQYNGRGVLIDTTPDFRTQALRARIERVDAILYTHAHADHIMGLDDIRPFNFRQKGPIPIHGSRETLQSIQRCFSYVFSTRDTATYVPKLDPVEIDGPFELFGETVTPIRLAHGSGESIGFRFGPLAYLTDHSEIPEESMALLHGLDVLFLDALRHKPHPTHSTVERSRRTVGLLEPKRSYFTHIGHDLSHGRTEEKLPPNIRLAYDGLEVRVR